MSGRTGRRMRAGEAAAKCSGQDQPMVEKEGRLRKAMRSERREVLGALRDPMCPGESGTDMEAFYPGNGIDT